MFGFLDSVLGLAHATAKIVLAPVEIGVELAKAVVKPIANAAEACVDEIKEIVKDDNQ